MTKFQLKSLAGIKGIAFDLDGTLYHGDIAIPCAVDLITYARKNTYLSIFLTNNSTKSRKDILQRLHNMGIICELHEIYSSGFATAHYTKENELPDVYISGSQWLKKEFFQLEVPVVSAKDAKTLVIGYDPEFSYEKLTDTLEVALGAEKILSCNKERTSPGKNSKKCQDVGQWSLQLNCVPIGQFIIL